MCFSKLRFSVSLILFFSALVFKAYAEDSSFYGMITGITAQTPGRSPKIHYSSSESYELKSNDRIKSGSTLLTNEKQAVELAIYKDDSPCGYIILAENTDMEIIFADQIRITMNYGRIRIVMNKKAGPVKVFSKTVSVDSAGTDFGLESLIDGENNTSGYVLCFDGEIGVSSRSSSQIGTMTAWGKCEFINEDIIFSKKFPKTDLDLWQGVMSAKMQNKPEDAGFILEKLTFVQIEERTTVEKKDDKAVAAINEETVTSDVIKKDTASLQEDETKSEEEITAAENTDLSTDKEETKSGIFDKEKFLSSFLSFQLGILGHDIQPQNFQLQNFGIKFVFDPGIPLFDDKFEFGFYADLNFFPYVLYYDLANGLQPGWDMFGRINTNSRFASSEWSFGSDQNLDAGRMVFDIFDDLLLKLKTIRYNFPDDKIYIKAGQLYGIDEPLKFSLDNYNPRYFSLLQRKVSLITKFDFGWFKANIYAEDAMPKGLYGTNFTMATPGKSFVFKFYFSSYIDCYDLVQFTQAASWFMPAQFNSSFILDTFNLPSFGLTFFLNGGVLVPFSSLLNETNSMAASSGLIFSFGFNIRGNVKNNEFNFSLEFVKDGKFGRIGMFDLSYGINRDRYFSRLASYFAQLASRSVNDFFQDHYFGFRARFGYSLLKYISLDLSYQWGTAFALTTYNITGFGPVPGTDAGSINYYDKLGFKITLDSQKKWKIPCDLYIQWVFEDLISTVGNTIASRDTYAFLASNSIFIGGNVNFHKGIGLYLQGGMYPFTGSVNFCFDAGIVLKPYNFIKKK